MSAKFGLLTPEDVIGPYDVYLADQSPAYRKAWGEFVTAQLDQKQSELRGRTIEVHAGAAYVEPLRAPLAARGASLTVPLAHLRQGEQLAWYNSGTPSAAAPPAGRHSRAAERSGSRPGPAAVRPCAGAVTAGSARPRPGRPAGTGPVLVVGR